MRQPLTDGKWFSITSEKEHNNVKACGRTTYDSMYFARVQMGIYDGPGQYLLLQYRERCPRNCCYDSVNEVLSAKEVVQETREQMRDLAEVLKKARNENTPISI